ncbi:MAG: NIPSNAP family protein [Rhizobium sp.]|nr:NIPSNAP family protein [Rhizobium sp.]MDM8014482.1 NIPSNAP family protein [Rhizobium sp.]
MPRRPITCEIRYRLDPGRIADFEEYARIWVGLIERHGGHHLGYFMPRERPDDAQMSFPGAGQDGEANTAVAIFTFPDEQSYLKYRQQVAQDPDGLAANQRFGKSPPFTSYERLFLTPLAQERVIEPPAREL